MRGYFWGNMYLSSIQQGIQSAHCMGDMFIKYEKLNDIPNYDTDQFITLHDWADNHKTMILLNGGYSETLRGLLQFFDNKQNPYPYAHFNEGEDALDGALTCVGIILPEKIYTAAALARSNADMLTMVSVTGELDVSAKDTNSGEAERWHYNSWEFKLILELNKYGLAS